MKVLIADKMSPLAQEVFKKNNVNFDVKTGLAPEELIKIIGEYEGLAIRSSTKVTKEILDHATNLKVIARAGIGVDNVDIPAATDKGVIVMNTPFGNSVTTAEHAIAMMFAIARSLPQASASTHAGKWEKSKFMGVELTGKNLGVIGCGNIGSIAIKKAQGLGMKILGFDPYLTAERAEHLAVQKVELDELLENSDFITLHVPLTDSTRNIIDSKALKKMKPTAFLINCARGGLVNEADLKDALDNDEIAGAALDVFEKEPAKENALFGHEKLICTPHLGASTVEAQENVAVQVAEQISNFLNNNVIENSLNIPSVSLEDAKILNPYIALGDKLGAFIGQIADGAIKAIRINYRGEASKLNIKPVTAAIIKSVLSNIVAEINIVNGRSIAEKRGIKIEDVLSTQESNYNTSITIEIQTEKETVKAVGTLFAGNPRIVKVNGIYLEASLEQNALYVENEDKPGLIGQVGKFLGDNGVNIANFHLGRNDKNTGNAIALIAVDSEIDSNSLKVISEMPSVKKVKFIKF